MAPSFGDERDFLGEVPVAGNTSPSCQDKRMMDEKISPVEKQLQYLLNKADEFQTQLLWRYGYTEKKKIQIFSVTCLMIDYPLISQHICMYISIVFILEQTVL